MKFSIEYSTEYSMEYGCTKNRISGKNRNNNLHFFGIWKIPRIFEKCTQQANFVFFRIGIFLKIPKKPITTKNIRYGNMEHFVISVLHCRKIYFSEIDRCV